MFVDSVTVERELVHERQWPFTIPSVAALTRDGLRLRRPVTFLVGENGSGKSTLVEAIAEAAGIDARGGRAGRKYGNQRGKTPTARRSHSRTRAQRGTGHLRDAFPADRRDARRGHRGSRNVRDAARGMG